MKPDLYCMLTTKAQISLHILLFALLCTYYHRKSEQNKWLFPFGPRRPVSSGILIQSPLIKIKNTLSEMNQLWKIFLYLRMFLCDNCISFQVQNHFPCQDITAR